MFYNNFQVTTFLTTASDNTYINVTLLNYYVEDGDTDDNQQLELVILNNVLHLKIRLLIRLLWPKQLSDKQHRSVVQRGQVQVKDRIFPKMAADLQAGHGSCKVCYVLLLPPVWKPRKDQVKMGSITGKIFQPT